MGRLFWIGAAGYPLLELAARGRTHPSMALAGGVGAEIIGKARKTGLSRPRQAIASGLAITAVEAAVGLAFNRRHQVWDYRAQPLNWRGQVCPLYTGLWCALSYGTLYALDKAEMQFYNGSIRRKGVLPVAKDLADLADDRRLDPVRLSRVGGELYHGDRAAD